MFSRNLDFLRGVEHPSGEMLSRAAITDEWRQNDRSFETICGLTGIDGVQEIVRRQLGQFGTKAALDIAGGANAAALRGLIAEGIVDIGLVTNYLDKRSDETISDTRISHVDGDLIESQTWNRVFDWQDDNAPEGFALIIHNPEGALQNLPSRFYRGATHMLLDRLQPGGIFLSQIPRALKPASACEGVRKSIQQREDIALMKLNPHLVAPRAILIVKR